GGIVGRTGHWDLVPGVESVGAQGDYSSGDLPLGTGGLISAPIQLTPDTQPGDKVRWSSPIARLSNAHFCCIYRRRQTVQTSWRGKVTMRTVARTWLALIIASLCPTLVLGGSPPSGLVVQQTSEYVQVDTAALQARIRKKGYVSGISQ